MLTCLYKPFQVIATGQLTQMKGSLGLFLQPINIYTWTVIEAETCGAIQQKVIIADPLSNLSCIKSEMRVYTDKVAKHFLICRIGIAIRSGSIHVFKILII